MNKEELLFWVQKNARRVKAYQWGQDGRNGTCDCIGLVIGAVRMAGGTWTGVHGTNYTVRNKMKSMEKITREDQLCPGDLVFKCREKGEKNYALPGRYQSDPDQRDYYHVGVVEKTGPLTIMHCSSGGIRRDHQLNNWRYHGEINLEVKKEMEKQIFASNGGKINVRQENRLSAPILFRLPSGSTVMEIRQDREWTEIEWQGKRGWMMTKFLSSPEEQVTLCLDRAAAEKLQKALQAVL